ncbi:ABC transporter substrate-binding protein [Streptomyces sp. JB150]|uniref:ABC transporter substrate-binding protein n=1 Tax=Streptomyces sp. JB150 TaxID=2714844 RepID=UPI00140D1D80|nr:ABC transporter substrate-binding protein [Streptomyces sp. JB150]QIJ64570.1 ABC transporter substrate-binding protein [Streptomyces sp. JB150]
MSFSRRNFLIATGVAAGSTMALSACSSGNAGGNSASKAPSMDKAKAATISVGTKADSQGPAPEMPGAKKGGTLYTLDQIDFDHLDPAQIYSSYTGAGSVLFLRGLTGYRVDSKGTTTLVGDLATDPGTMKDGGKTWSFTLKDGVKWEDGEVVTIEDVRHTFERLFADFVTEGPRYPQNWLEGGDKYKGPYEGKHLKSIEVDGNTITFRLKEAHGDFNYMLAMRGFSIVPKKHDTKKKYDKRPFSCGPYKIESRDIDKSLVLVRNEHWDADKDPVRNGYPDKVVMQFGFQSLASTDRYIADRGNDQFAVSLLNEVASERIQKVMGDATLKKRVLTQVDTTCYYFPINMTRVKDQKVRQAINWAWPAQQLKQQRGGSLVTETATTIISPLTPGHADFDLYGKKTKPMGDPEKAKALLKEAGKEGQKLVIAFQQSDKAVKEAVTIKNALEKAGFSVVTKQVDKTSFYSEISQLDNGFDLFAAGWGPDWPAGYTVIQPCWDGSQIADGGVNWAQLDNTSVNKAIAAATAETDPEKANKAWGEIDRQIMELAACVPDYHPIRNYFHGSKVGGVVYNAGDTCVAISKVYVKA